MIYVTGDVHYPIDRQHLIDLRDKISSDDIVIVCGDMGLAWDSKNRTDKAIKELMNAVPYTILFVDGNHEHFPILNSFPTETRYNGTVGVLSDRIFHLKRAETYEIDGLRFIAFGGARSTDRGWRVEGESWFPEEEFSKDEEEKLWQAIAADNNFDYIITHEAPSDIVEQIYPYANQVGFSRTQQLFNSLSERVNFKKWYFGHHHIAETFGADAKYICLYDDVRELISGNIVLEAKKADKIDD